jgi:tRNA A-37 threonylcarbamoyl transferase component Bud32
MNHSGTPDDLLLGQIAVQKGILRQEQLDEGLREQAASQSRGETPQLCEILIRQGSMTTDDLVRLVREQSQRAEGLPVLPRYEVQARLGEGATAVVYRAWDRDLRRPVALKILRESAGFSEIGRQRFRREAQAAAGLSHPNVITVHDAGESEGRLYLVMEIVEGKPLSEIFRDPALPLKERVRLIERAARGIAAAHEKGIVHRDLKPQNILVAAGGEPKVADFGLAHMVDSTTALTRTGTTLGTPLYMSPEQVEGKAKEISPRSDVWALGAILYEALFGAPPFLGETHLEIYEKIARGEPPPPKAGQSIPRDLETIALKALEKPPARRYPTAREFADDLRRSLDGETVAARRSPPWVKLWGRHRRALILVGAVLLAAVAGVVVVQGRQAARARVALSQAAQDEKQGRLQEARDGYRLVRELEPSNGEALRGLRRMEEELARRHQAVLDQARIQEEAMKFMKPALIESVVGKVETVTDSSRAAARPGQTLPSGSGVQTTGSESTARIKYLGVVGMELDGETLVHQWLEESASGGTKAVSLKRGAMRVTIPAVLPGKPLVLSTPHLDVQSAPASFRLIVAPGSTRLLVDQGALRATRRADGVSLLVEQGSSLECDDKGSRAPEPLSAPGGRLVEDFESHVDVYWAAGTQSSKGSLVRSKSAGIQGSGSIRMEYSVPAGEMVWAGAFYTLARDWSAFPGISFWFNGAKTNSQIAFEILENVNPRQPGSNNERFWHVFRDDFIGWKKFELGWAQFRRRPFANAPDDGFERKEIWGMSLIVLAPDAAARKGIAEFDQIELMGTSPETSPEPWRSIFDGKTMDTFVREGPATWHLENGLLVHDTTVPGNNAMQTRTSFRDADVRVRFDVVQDMDNFWFAIRQGADGSYSAGWWREEVRALRGRPHDLIFVCRGETVSATLDGQTVPVEARGRPREGPLQFDASAPGLRIFSIDYRAAR